MYSVNVRNSWWQFLIINITLFRVVLFVTKMLSSVTKQEIYKHISYPSRAVTKKQEGTVRIAVTIDRHGELVGLVTTQESGYASLDKAALRAVEKAAPFDALPEEMKTQLFELSIPITFRLQ